MHAAWIYLLTFAELTIKIVATAHAVLYKRDARSVIGWVGLIWLVPFLGALLYWLFGINRIARRAKALRPAAGKKTLSPEPTATINATPDLADHSYLLPLMQLVGNVTGLPLTVANSVKPLANGDEAYPAMLQAISEATRSIALTSYIFDNDQIGQTFARHLAEAQQRGVEVRVLIDSVGARYSWPTIFGNLRKLGIRAAAFNPTLIPRSFRYSNLRSHRKLLVIDGRDAFTGGLNIRDSCLLKNQSEQPIQDLHFCVNGPVVRQLLDTFAVDWYFATEETLTGPAWDVAECSPGATFARVISDGPDESFDYLRLTLLGAIDCAQHSIKIATPYFLPDATLISSLNVAALQGIRVEILIPAKNNLRFVQWASTAQLWQVLERGCHVSLSPPPFDHTKLMIIDDRWVLLGSANWDARSLRLNFELNLECYDRELGKQLAEYFDNKFRQATPVTLQDVNERNLWVRLRDGTARLLSPYL